MVKPTFRPVALAAGLPVAGGLAYLGAWPVPIEPVAWQPPTAPAQTTGRTVGPLHVSAVAEGHGPEDLDLDPEGRVVGGLHDGRLLRWTVDWDLGTATAVEELANTGGRPLGLHWDADGRLLIADAFAGLLRLEPSGQLTTLTADCGGRPLVFTDDLETDAAGRIWFSDASVRFDQAHWKLDILENGPSGRLCVYDPATRQTAEVLDGLHFANGVAIDPEQQFVLVNETSRYRVTKWWIDGPKAGSAEVLIDNLPGFPDGISTGEHGIFWIAIAGPRNPLVDAAGPYPFLREVMVRLPQALQPRPERSVRVLGIDADGALVHDLHEPEGSEFAVVTSVQQVGERLLLGSLTEPAWAWTVAPPAP